MDFVRVHDVGLRAAKDPVVLDWAAARERVVVTHDVATMISFARIRIDGGLPMPGLIVVDAQSPLGRVIDDLILVVECVPGAEIRGTVVHLPI